MRRTPSITLAAVASLLGACSPYHASRDAMDQVFAAEYAHPRAHYADLARSSTGDRDELLLRLKSSVLALADGLAPSAEPDLARAYEILRTQGLNQSAAGATIVFGESASRTWKGEPFEQAMGYYTVAIADALASRWDNVRADLNNAIVLLQDFSQQDFSEQDFSNPTDSSSTDAPATVLSDFEPAYLLKAIACRHLDLHEELDETLAQLVQVAPRLAPMAERIRSGSYDTVIIVDAGMAPEKVASGNDGVLVSYQPRSPSDDAPLLVTTPERTEAFPVATDLNRLALDLKWNNLEGLRRARSGLGTALQAGGVGVAALSDDDGARIAGISAALVGTLLRASSTADLRHLELYPQRSYVALATLAPHQTLELQIDARPETRIVLQPALVDRSSDLVALYVRLPGRPSAWAASARVEYANDAVPHPESLDPRLASLPWILGGRCLRTPTRALLADYHHAGLLTDLSYQDLLDLYRDEGITIVDPSDISQPIAVHLLEGGTSLFTPRAGSTGFTRLYAQVHPPYQPRSDRVRALAARLATSQGDSP